MKTCIRLFVIIGINYLLFVSNAYSTVLINQQYGLGSGQSGYLGVSRHSLNYLGTPEYDVWSSGGHNWSDGYATASSLFSLPSTSSDKQLVSIEFDILHYLSFQTANVVSFRSPKAVTGYASVKLVDDTLQGQVLWEYSYNGNLHDGNIFHKTLATSFWLESSHQYEFLYYQSTTAPSPFPITNVIYGDEGEEAYARIDFFNILQTDIQINAVPEPSTFTLLVLGIMGGVVVRNRYS